MTRPLILALMIVPSMAAASPPVPPALGQVVGGVWEVTGPPGLRAPLRQCIADILTFAQFEHRSRVCSRTALGGSATSANYSYSCGPGDFGQSQIDVLTPRSLRISTQGVSQQLPFNYVIQARRIGDCPKSAPTPRH